MAAKKTTKAVKTYTATWNKRIEGVIKTVTVDVVKKGGKYYTAEGEEAPAWATITEK